MIITTIIQSKYSENTKMTSNPNILILKVKGIDMPTIRVYAILAHEGDHLKYQKIKHLTSKRCKLKIE